MSCNLPNGWKEKELNQFIDIKHGYAFKGKDFSDNKTKYILLTPGNFKISGGFKSDKFKYYSESAYIPEEYILNKDDLLVTMTDLSKAGDTLGYPLLVPVLNNKVLLHNQRLGKIEFFNDELDKKFLYYTFCTNLYRGHVLGSATGTTVRHTAPNRIVNYKLQFPKEINEQKRIAAVLSAFDDKIELNNQMNQTLEEMATVFFKEWFLDKVDNSWIETKIKDFDVIVTDYVANGSFKSLAENVNYSDNKDYSILIRLTDYNNNFSGKFVYIDEHGHDFLKKSELQGGEVVISNVGAYSGTVFKVPSLNRPMTLGPNSIVLKSDFNNFFYLFFKSFYGQYLLDGIITGSAQPKFNKTAFRSLTIKYPSIDYLKDFEKTVIPYFEKIELNRQQNQILKKQRDTLLPKLMSGEIRV